METTIKAKFKVEILVNKERFTSCENTIRDLNNLLQSNNSFQLFESSKTETEKYIRVKTYFNFQLNNLELSKVFGLKELLPSYILDIYFY